MFLNLFLLYQVVRPLGRKSVNKYLCVFVYIVRYRQSVRCELAGFC